MGFDVEYDVRLVAGDDVTEPMDSFYSLLWENST